MVSEYCSACVSHVSLSTTVRAEIITELILARADPTIFKTFLLELMAFRRISAISL